VRGCCAESCEVAARRPCRRRCLEGAREVRAWMATPAVVASAGAEHKAAHRGNDAPLRFVAGVLYEGAVETAGKEHPSGLGAGHGCADDGEDLRQHQVAEAKLSMEVVVGVAGGGFVVRNLGHGYTVNFRHSGVQLLVEAAEVAGRVVDAVDQRWCRWLVDDPVGFQEKEAKGFFVTSGRTAPMLGKCENRLNALSKSALVSSANDEPTFSRTNRRSRLGL